ncbi:MAG: hypothetical protein M3Z09_01650 [Acidobacteriota bacterium]|nr:hypothetical protein [Acidobacteriota bacterium]
MRTVCVLALMAGFLLGADISGTWNVTVEIQGNTGTPTFVLKQDGGKLTGTYSGMLGEAPVTGMVQGDQVEFSFEAKSDQVSGKVTYKGTISGGKMKGTVMLGELGSGTWEGTRK